MAGRRPGGLVESPCDPRRAARAERQLGARSRHRECTQLGRRRVRDVRSGGRHQVAELPLSRVRDHRSPPQHDLGSRDLRPSSQSIEEVDMLNATQRGFARLHRQRGVVLFIALIVLVVMSLAGIALMRSVGTGVLIAGNLGVKQATTSAGDLGVEAGRDWLVKADPSALANDAVASGYISYWQLEVDPSNPPNSSWWKDNAVLVNVAGTPYKDYDVRYVVHRMCK